MSMRLLRRPTLIALLVLGPVVVTGAPGLAAPAARPMPGTRVLATALNSVDVVSAQDVWAVGSTWTGDSIREFIQHWDGHRWRASPSPDPGHGQGSVLNSVSAVSASDAWAVGQYFDGVKSVAFSVHWNGVRWHQVHVPVTEGSNLLGVSAASSMNAWAVGAYGDDSVATLTLHWDGARWRRVTSPAPPPDSGLSGVTVISKSEAWAVGGYGTGGGALHPLVVRWDGTRWRRTATPEPPGALATTLSSVTHVSPTNIWSVGGSYVDGQFTTLVTHWDGTAWTQVRTPSPGRHGSELDAVSAASRANIWAVGEAVVAGGVTKTLILHWDGRGWTRSASPSPAGKGGSSLTGVSAIGPARAWAVGSTPSTGLVERWDGASWRRD